MAEKSRRMYVAGIAFYLALTGPFQVFADNAGSLETQAPSMEDLDMATAGIKYTKATGGGRLLALINPAVANYVVRAKGVKEVTHPWPGIYCIQPSGSWDVTKAVPMVTVEWSLSEGNSIMAVYSNETPPCPAKHIQVQTYKFEKNGVPVIPYWSDSISFTIMVP